MKFLQSTLCEIESMSSPHGLFRKKNRLSIIYVFVLIRIINIYILCFFLMEKVLRLDKFRRLSSLPSASHDKKIPIKFLLPKNLPFQKQR